MSANISGDYCSLRSIDLFTVWLGIYSLFLPLFIFVLYVGYRQWTSRSSAVSHSDAFTLNMIMMEILNIVGVSVYCWGQYTGDSALIHGGEKGTSVAVMGQIFFHNLTCAERYLAVVHPITYMRLKKRGGVRIRNISIGCAWMISFLNLIIQTQITPHMYQLLYAIVPAVLSLLVVSFFSVSVLCVLIRPAPGEVGRDRKGFDQSKRMAFYTILAILGALLSRFFTIFISYILFFVPTLDYETKCLLSVSTFWFSLPSSLVLPLLFLHRAGKLAVWKQILMKKFVK